MDSVKSLLEVHTKGYDDGARDARGGIRVKLSAGSRSKDAAKFYTQGYCWGWNETKEMIKDRNRS